jgi:hypothetical protein
MNAIAQWSENTRSAVMRAGIAGFAALILVLLFGIYINFFPTPLTVERFVTADKRLRGEPTKIPPTIRE